MKRLFGLVWLAAVVLLLATRRKPAPPPDPPRMWDLYPPSRPSPGKDENTGRKLPRPPGR